MTLELNIIRMREDDYDFKKCLEFLVSVTFLRISSWHSNVFL